MVRPKNFPQDEIAFSKHTVKWAKSYETEKEQSSRYFKITQEVLYSELQCIHVDIIVSHRKKPIQLLAGLHLGICPTPETQVSPEGQEGSVGESDIIYSQA